MTDTRRPTFDNPIELEKVPPDRLSFEFPGVPDETVAIKPLLNVQLTILACLAVGSISLPLLFQRVEVERSLLTLVAGVTALLLVAETLGRPVIADLLDWKLRAGLGVLMTVAALAAGAAGTRIGWIASGTLLLVAAGNFSFHWFAVRQRYDDPIVPEMPGDSFEPNGFIGSLLPAIVLALLVGHLPILPGGPLTVVVAAVSYLLWWLRSGEEPRSSSELYQQFAFVLHHAYAYPDTTQPVPGIMASPIGPRWVRSLPACLYIGFTFVATAIPDASLAVATLALDQQSATTLLSRIATWFVVGPGVLFLAGCLSVRHYTSATN